MSRRRRTQLRSQRASRSRPSLVSTIPRTGSMPKKIIKHLISGVYYTGAKVVMSGGELMDIVDAESLQDIAVKAATGYVAEEFITPIITPMLPPLPGAASMIVKPAIMAAVHVGASMVINDLTIEEAPMEFFMSLGASVAADLTDDTISSILGY